MIQNTFIHSDISVAEHTAVLSLGENNKHNGHLAFWRHKQTGWDEPDPSDEAGMALTEADGFDEERWERIGFVALPPNRCIIFPAALFHSRYPKEWQETWPRRIEVFFFELRGDTQPGSVSRI